MEKISQREKAIHLTKIIVIIFMMMAFSLKIVEGKEVNVKGLFALLNKSSETYRQKADYIRTRFVIARVKISSDDKRKIINSILKWSKHYGLDYKMVTAVVEKESTFNKRARHAAVTIEVPTKPHWIASERKKVRAVGLMGVVYEVWRFKLSSIGLTSKKSLSSIDDNIHAGCYILDRYINGKRQIKGTDSRVESGLLRYYGVMRRNGKVVKTYSKQVFALMD
jgi:hypothetical protein